MKFKMAEKSLFAILLRAPWWVSFVVTLALALGLAALLPPAYKVVGAFGALPFLVIGFIAAWRQRNTMSSQRISELTEPLGNMSWQDFSALVEKGFLRQGYEVMRLNDGPADFKITKNARVTLVSAKRWKAAALGVEAVKDLLTASEKHDATSCFLIGLGRISEPALALAAQNSVSVMGPESLALLLV